MLTRTLITAAAAVAMAALGATLTGCGSQAQNASVASRASTAPASRTPSPGRSPRSSPPVVAPPMILVVRLGSSFSPGTLRLGVGQKFQLEVSKSVEATIQGIPAHCSSGSVMDIAGGLLSAQCSTGSSYLFTAGHAGSTTLTASVRPHCAAGSMCPQWMSSARLKITIT